MGVFDNLFKKKAEPAVATYQDFWNWFTKNEKALANAVADRENIEKLFFDPITEKLNQIKDGYLMLVGVDDGKLDIVFTADGSVKQFVFIEELVAAAPALPGWKFTILKPGLDVKDLAINMGNFTFNHETLAFYAHEQEDYPDEIDIVLVYDDFEEDDKAEVFNGAYLFLENYLGELNLATTVDALDIVPRNQAEQPLVPISKLKDYLVWRQKEFVEKYEGTRHNSEDDTYTGFESETVEGKMLFAMINTSLLSWDAKASHPWMLNVNIAYEGTNDSGMPDPDQLNSMNRLEEAIAEELKDSDGYLNLGRQTGNNMRDNYFACKDFRKPSKVLHEISRNHPDLKISYEIYKDKYWQSLSMFMR